MVQFVIYIPVCEVFVCKFLMMQIMLKVLYLQRYLCNLMVLLIRLNCCHILNCFMLFIQGGGDGRALQEGLPYIFCPKKKFAV